MKSAIVPLAFLIFLTSPAYAQEYATNSANVHLTVPTVAEESFTAPVLINPIDESALNIANPSFIFTVASSSVGIDHYDLLIDDILVAGSISGVSITQDAYFFSITRSGSTITVKLKNNLPDGYHSWKVVAYNDTNSTAASSTWQFWIDTIPPQIVLEKVSTQKLNWDSNHPFNIPSNKDLIVTTSKPTLSGTVEPYANFKIAISTEFINTSTYANGKWSYTPNSLKPNLKYTVYLTATDAANNHTSFPLFTLTYQSPKVTSTISSSPTITPTLTPTIIAPSPSLTALPYQPPEKPLPPPPPQPKIIPTPVTQNTITTLTLIAIIGLITHLSMATFGTGVKLSLLPKLIWALIIPPISKLSDDVTLAINLNHTISPLPYTTVTILSLEPLNSQIDKLKSLSLSKLNQLLIKTKNLPLKSFLSSSLGTFNLSLQNGFYYILTSHSGFYIPNEKQPSFASDLNTKSYVYSGQLISINNKLKSIINQTTLTLSSSQGEWFVPLIEYSPDSLMPLERFRKLIMHARIVPLLLSFVSAIFLLYFLQNVWPLLLTLFCLLLLFTQYLNTILQLHTITLDSSRSS